MEREIFKKADQIMSKRRAEAERLNDSAEREMLKTPEYAEADKMLASLRLQYFEAVGSGKDATETEQKISDCLNRMADLAVSKGIRLENYRCAICKDKGKDHGEFCACYKALLNELSYEEQGLNLLPDFKFSDHIAGIDAKLDALYDTFVKYVEAFPNNNKRNIILTGPTGVGKSCLLAAVANAIKEKGFVVYYKKAIRLNEIFRDYHMANGYEREAIFAPLLSSDLLIIDDLGTEPIFNNVTLNYLYMLLEERGNKHIMVTTNLTHQEILDRYGERVTSRLLDASKSQILMLPNKDLRQIKR